MWHVLFYERVQRVAGRPRFGVIYHDKWTQAAHERTLNSLPDILITSDGISEMIVSGEGTSIIKEGT
jgi:hypothetical protein